jgi:hypothetical protein
MVTRSMIALLAFSIASVASSADACCGWGICRPSQRCCVQRQCTTKCCGSRAGSVSCGSCASCQGYSGASTDSKIAQIEDQIRILQKDVEELKKNKVDKAQ